MRLTRARYERRIGLWTNVTTCSRKSWLQSRLHQLAAGAAANLKKINRG